MRIGGKKMVATSGAKNATAHSMLEMQGCLILGLGSPRKPRRVRGRGIVIQSLRLNVAQNVVQTNPKQPQYSPNMGNIGIVSR